MSLQVTYTFQMYLCCNRWPYKIKLVEIEVSTYLTYIFRLLPVLVTFRPGKDIMAINN